METPEQKLMEEVETELARARSLFKPIHSPHEALGIIEEEFIEFRDEVFAFNLGKNRDTRPAMKKELVQLATMALRAVLEAMEFDPTATPRLEEADVRQAVAVSARVSWKDEISYSHDLNSEGLEQLKEAIKQTRKVVL